MLTVHTGPGGRALSGRHSSQCPTQVCAGAPTSGQGLFTPKVAPPPENLSVESRTLGTHRAALYPDRLVPLLGHPLPGVLGYLLSWQSPQGRVVESWLASRRRVSAPTTVLLNKPGGLKKDQLWCPRHPHSVAVAAAPWSPWRKDPAACPAACAGFSPSAGLSSTPGLWATLALPAVPATVPSHYRSDAGAQGGAGL